MSTILSIGNDTQLLQLRSAVLRQSGYTVVEICNPHIALSGFLRTTPDLVLICHTIDPQRQAILIHDIRAFARKTPILSLDVRHPELEADTVVSSIDGPRKMLLAVAHLLAGNGRSV